MAPLHINLSTGRLTRRNKGDLRAGGTTTTAPRLSPRRTGQTRLRGDMIDRGVGLDTGQTRPATLSQQACSPTTLGEEAARTAS